MTMNDSLPSKNALGYVALAVASGFCFPFQSRVNGSLAQAIGTSTGAAAISFAIGLAVLVVGAIVVPSFRRATRSLFHAAAERRFPIWYLSAGVLGAFLVYAQSSAVPLIGVALVSVAVIAGQTTSGLGVDRMGFGTGKPQPLTFERLAGVALTIIAVAWSVAGSINTETGFVAMLIIVLPLLAGIGSGFQQAMNGAITRGTHHPFAPTLSNFLAGSIALGVAWAVQIPFVHPQGSGELQWWMLTGGPLGIVYIAASAFLVPRIGVLLVTVSVVAGQLIGSLVIDVIFPTGSAGISFVVVAALVLTLVAVAITSGVMRVAWTRLVRNARRRRP